MSSRSSSAPTEKRSQTMGEGSQLRTITPKKIRKLRAGARVKVKSEVKSPYAGRKGVVLFAGDKVCDVKFLPKKSPRNHENASAVDEFCEDRRIDSIPREWLESARAGVDLAGWFDHGRMNQAMSPGNGVRRWRKRQRLWVILGAIIGTAAILWLVLW